MSTSLEVKGNETSLGASQALFSLCVSLLRGGDRGDRKVRYGRKLIRLVIAVCLHCFLQCNSADGLIVDPVVCHGAVVGLELRGKQVTDFDLAVAGW